MLPEALVKGLNPYKVGVLGGMGSYATHHFFGRLLDAFDVEKEWQRPRIIIDNNCVLPSRTRAILYDERREQLVQGMADSIRSLHAYGVDVIVMPCNTAHSFRAEVSALLHGEDDVLLDMLEVTAEAIPKGEVFVLATEGTVATKVYNGYCEPRGISIRYADADVRSHTNDWIEVVKQKRSVDCAAYHQFISGLGPQVVLGCTELSVLDAACGAPDGVRVFDPIGLLVERVHALATQTSSAN